MLYFFKPGDEVRIKDNLEVDKEYGNVSCTKAMVMFCLGQEDKIKYQVESGLFKGAYRLERLPFFWSDEMIELLEPVKEVI
jgi:hypothetical protein